LIFHASPPRLGSDRRSTPDPNLTIARAGKLFCDGSGRRRLILLAGAVIACSVAILALWIGHRVLKIVLAQVVLVLMR